MSHPGNDHLIDLARDNDLDEEAITIHSTDNDIPISDIRDTSKIRDMVMKFGRYRQLQGQHEGPEDGWVKEPYDLRCEADDLLEDIMTLVG